MASEKETQIKHSEIQDIYSLKNVHKILRIPHITTAVYLPFLILHASHSKTQSRDVFEIHFFNKDQQHFHQKKMKQVYYSIATIYSCVFTSSWFSSLKKVFNN